jgi:3-isopropylmalate/(R)-2-methylmalate dehydratase small subunit
MSHSGIVESGTFNLPVDNIDTDQIIPGHFLTTTERDGLGRYCFHSWRFDADGSEKPGHPFSGFDEQHHQVLVAGRNFGCGSSREHAPWALLDFGFKAVISSQFADIFRSNSLKNGLLPVVVEDHVVEFLLAHPGHPVKIDIGNNTLSVQDYGEFEFPLDPFSAYCLTRGIDQLDFILEQEDDISRFEQGHEGRG